MSAGAPAEGAWPSPRAGWYAVGVLLLAYTFGFVDRAILTILVEPIQRDFHLNDTQIGLLHGFAFVIFYVSLGVPLGWLADRTHRVRLIGVSIVVWSLMTAACGLASGFGGLFAARIGVGVGEAGLSPAGYSLIADLFPPRRRSSALGVYTLGIFVGSGLAILCGGAVLGLIGQRPTVSLPVVGAVRGWQAVFFAVGLPGFLVAALSTTVREPARRFLASEAGAREGLGAELRRVGAHMGRRGAVYGPLIAGFSFLGVPFNVALLWARPYLSRHFGVSPSQGAVVVGLTMVVFATVGLLVGSFLCDRAQARGCSDATVRTGLVAALLVAIPSALLPLAPSLPWAAAALAGVMVSGASAYGAGPAALALITPNRMRATVGALYLLGANVVGLAMGPVATGALTDYVFRDKGAVGVSASIVSVGCALVAALCFARVRRPFGEAVEGPA